MIAVLVAAAFWPALQAGFLDWDDQLTVVDNPKLAAPPGELVGWAFGTFFMGHYQPLSWLSLALDRAIWGLDPLGFHLTNLLLHLVNSLLVLALVLAVLERIGAALQPRPRLLLATAATLFWAVHPLRVESVVWVTERRDVLSAALLLAATWVYLRAAARAGRGAIPVLSPAGSAIAVLFAASLLAKAGGVVFVPALLLLDLLLRRVERHDVAAWRPLVVEKLPLLALSAVAVGLAPLAQDATAAMVPWSVHPLADRLLVMIFGTCYYLLRPWFTWPLSPLYELPVPIGPERPLFLVALVLFAALCLTGALLLWRRRHRVLAFWALYLLPLLPVLGLFQSGPQLVADRYSYLPGAVLAGGVAVFVAARLAASSRRDRRAALVVAALCVALLAAATCRYALAWRDTAGLWQHALAVVPSCGFCREALGLEQLRQGDRATGMRTLAEVLRDRPNLMKANAALARELERVGELAAAREHYLRAHRLRPDLPVFLRRYADLSERLGDHAAAAAAREQLRRAGAGADRAGQE